VKQYLLDNNHRIDADALQWILQERSTSGRGRYTWRNVGYYVHLEELLHSYRQRSERTFGGTLPKGLVESKRAADRAWEAVSRMLERNPEVETMREQIGVLEEQVQALKRRANAS
jgi:hypothetical protein